MGKIGKRLALLLVLIFLTSLVLLSTATVKAQTTASIVINPDGSITGTYSIEHVGNSYILTENISGNIQVQKSGVTIDGAGYSLDGGIDLTNGIGPNLPSPTRPEITNVTVKNLHVNGGIGTNGGGNDTFYNDVFSSGNQQQGEFSIQLLGCSNNNISYCRFNNGSQISMDYSANLNTITECNLPSYGILVWLSGSETVDNNYWSDYASKYPNATEVDHSGIGNTPYVFLTLPNGAQPAVFQDNHPSMKPVAIPLTGSSSPSPSPTVPEFPAIALLPLLLVVTVVVVLRHRKTVHLI